MLLLKNNVSHPCYYIEMDFPRFFSWKRRCRLNFIIAIYQPRIEVLYIFAIILSNPYIYLVFLQVLTSIMLNRRSQIYEIQKPKVNNGGHRGCHKPDNKMAAAAGFVATSAASVHSNSFNFSSPSSGTSAAASSSNGNRESHNNLAVRKTTKQQPRMGIPIMTSTPRGGQTRTSSTNGKIFLLTLLLK